MIAFAANDPDFFAWGEAIQEEANLNGFVEPLSLGRNGNQRDKEAFGPLDSSAISGKVWDQTDCSEKENIQTNSSETRKRTIWRCAVCQDHLERSQGNESGRETKSKRVSKIPSRFRDDTDIVSAAPPEFPKHHDISKKCTLCPYKGGAMSRLHRKTDARGLWVHEICRIWCSEICGVSKEGTGCDESDAAVDGLEGFKPFHNYIPAVCVLCGNDSIENINSEEGETPPTTSVTTNEVDMTFKAANRIIPPGLVKCAAQGCTIMFHPLCAILFSKIEVSDPVVYQIRNNNTTKGSKKNCSVNFQKKKEEDHYWCNQYVLTLLQTKRTEGTLGNLKGKYINCVLPVTFCGLHNPRRDKAFYGCPAGGGSIASAMRVPPI